MQAVQRPMVVGNWKMHGLSASLAELRAIIAGAPALKDAVDLMICPPATLISLFARTAAGTGVLVGGQDCHAEPAGAHTGDISAEMLADAGASAVIVGHSERRVDHHETDEIVRAKALAAWRAKLTAIVCVGEHRSQRDGGQALAVVEKQLAGSLPDGATPENTVVAYEPVWAIGTGLTPTVTDVSDMHKFICSRLAARFGDQASGIRILYGGSVKAANAAELLKAPNVGGALVGGASLRAADFLPIAAVYR